MPFKCIDSFSQVLVYDVDPGGYQRKPESKHYNKIRDYILKESKSFILPTSIVLGMDDDILNKVVKNDQLVLDDSVNVDPIFRIVDGQHRIYGMREAAQ